jgi:hypothetical protein
VADHRLELVGLVSEMAINHLIQGARSALSGGCNQPTIELAPAINDFIKSRHLDISPTWQVFAE